MEAKKKKAPKKKGDKPAGKRGRVSKYEELGISQKLKSIEGWARHGSTLEEIAEMLGVSPATIYRWKGAYLEFREALRVGAREANGEILNSAFKQAVGYTERVQEVQRLKKIAFLPNEKGEPEIVRDIKGNPIHEDVAEVVEYDKFFEPDPRMTMFMLSNRLKEEYKIKVEGGDGNKEIVLKFEEAPNKQSGLTEEELMG